MLTRSNYRRRGDVSGGDASEIVGGSGGGETEIDGGSEIGGGSGGEAFLCFN